MTKNIFILAIILFNTTVYSQKVFPKILYTVDTSQTEIKAVYDLYTNYLNSRPDTGYFNPFWNKKELEKYAVKGHKFYPDEANWWLFRGENADSLLAVFQPTVLAIEKQDEHYVIRTIFTTQDTNYTKTNWNMPYITRYAAIREGNEWKLANNISYEIKSWNKYRSKYFNFYYPAHFALDTLQTQNADKFCDSIYKLFGTKWDENPYDYYVSDRTEDIYRLANFDFMIAPLHGTTNTFLRRTFYAGGKFYVPHEFVHLVAAPSKNGFVNEGLATWLGGLGRIGKRFSDDKILFCEQLKQFKNVSLKDIYDFKIHNTGDNNLFYMSSALIIEKIYKTHGIKGVQLLLTLPSNDYEDYIRFMKDNFRWSEEDLWRWVEGCGNN